jgi:hypothetical protein
VKRSSIFNEERFDGRIYFSFTFYRWKAMTGEMSERLVHWVHIFSQEFRNFKKNLAFLGLSLELDIIENSLVGSHGCYTL